MTRFEKSLVNRKRKAKINIRKLHNAFQDIEIENIKTVLELGCGVGYVSAYLADSYDFVVYSTEHDVEQITSAREFHAEKKNSHFQVEDAARLSFSDASMGMVISQNVFHHYNSK